MDDPAMEELGFALQPRTKRDKRKERKVGLDNGRNTTLTLLSYLTQQSFDFFFFRHRLKGKVETPILYIAQKFRNY